MTDQEKDPVVNSSLSKPLFISSALLVLSFVWGLYDEVYGTRPWKVFGEGPAQIKPGMFGEEKTPDFTAQDIRFTSRGKTLYAIALDWPQKAAQLVIKSLNTNDGLLAKGEISNVSLLGSNATISWQHDGDGLRIFLPRVRPGDFAYVFEILLK